MAVEKPIRIPGGHLRPGRNSHCKGGEKDHGLSPWDNIGIVDVRREKAFFNIAFIYQCTRHHSKFNPSSFRIGPLCAP